MEVLDDADRAEFLPLGTVNAITAVGQPVRRSWRPAGPDGTARATLKHAAHVNER